MWPLILVAQIYFKKKTKKKKKDRNSGCVTKTLESLSWYLFATNFILHLLILTAQNQALEAVYLQFGISLKALYIFCLHQEHRSCARSIPGPAERI